MNNIVIWTSWQAISRYSSLMYGEYTRVVALTFIDLPTAAIACRGPSNACSAAQVKNASSRAHAQRTPGLVICADRVEAGAACSHLIPIVVRANSARPRSISQVVLAKHPDTGRFALYVLTGLGLEENLFWSGTELDATYAKQAIRN